MRNVARGAHFSFLFFLIFQQMIFMTMTFNEDIQYNIDVIYLQIGVNAASELSLCAIVLIIVSFVESKTPAAVQSNTSYEMPAPLEAQGEPLLNMMSEAFLEDNDLYQRMNIQGV